MITVLPTHAGAIKEALEHQQREGVIYVCRGERSACDGDKPPCQFCYQINPEGRRHWAQVVQGFIRGDA